MKSLRVKNLRSLVDTGNIDIKPITLLIGKNSSGKSSFLRIFPLLRQSFDVRTRGPILWYGQYVDFGEFNTAIRKNSDENEITIEFSHEISKDDFEGASVGIMPIFGRKSNILAKDLLVLVSIKLAYDDNNNITYVSCIDLTIDDDIVSIRIDNKANLTKFVVNDLDVLNIGKYLIREANIIPIIISKSRLEAMEQMFSKKVWDFRVDAVRKTLIKAMQPFFHTNTSDWTIFNTIGRIQFGDKKHFLSNMKKIKSTITWQKRVSRLTINSPVLNRIRNLVLSDIILEILVFSEDYLRGVSDKVKYVAPIRATAERFYRGQELAVDEVDFQGQNLAVFLSSLDIEEQERFKKWTIDNLGFEVYARSGESQIEIFIKAKGDESYYNLIDMGFGFSQVLPIIAQLWAIIDRELPEEDYKISDIRYVWAKMARRKRHYPQIVTIEQPELHLHPDHQAKLADMLIAVANIALKLKVEVKLIIETHSEVIVNRIGNQIADGKINHEDVNVVLFEKESPFEDTDIRIASYDGKGNLKNWPYGFFEPEED